MPAQALMCSNSRPRNAVYLGTGHGVGCVCQHGGEPGTVWLFFALIVGFVGFRRLLLQSCYYSSDMTGLCVTLMLSILAGPPPPASGHRCSRPLEFGDFNRYDVIANNQLHRSEMTGAQFACFVQQLIRTRDRRVRSYFVGRLQNSLWEGVRRELLRLRRTAGHSAQMRKRIKDLLAYEFTNRTLRGATVVRYNFGWDRVVDRSTPERTVYRYALHEVLGSGRLSINIPFARWRWKSSAALVASYLGGATSERHQVDGVTDTSSRQTHSYPALVADSNLSLTQRNARFRLLLASQVRRYWEPLADRLASRGLISGTLEVRKPWSTGLGVRVDGSWLADRFAPPLDADFNRQQIDRATLNAKLSYHFGRLGIIGTHALVDNETTTAFNITMARRNTSALLGHLRFKGGYLRFGGGGGVWRESFSQLDDPAPSVTEGAAAHGRVEVQWKPVKWLSGNVVTVVSANRSEGDFNGWYPGWSSSFKLMFSTRRVSAQAVAGWAGHHRDLEHRQTRHVAWSWAEATVHTSDGWNLRSVVWGGRSRQTDFQEYDESWWGGSLSAGVRILSRPDLWLEASGSCSGYRYLDDGLSRDRLRTTAALYASGRF
jgi:hypothetical protein